MTALQLATAGRLNQLCLVLLSCWQARALWAHAEPSTHSPAAARMARGARLMLLRRVLCRLGAQRTLLALRTLVCMVLRWVECREATGVLQATAKPTERGPFEDDCTLPAKPGSSAPASCSTGIHASNCNRVKQEQSWARRSLPMKQRNLECAGRDRTHLEGGQQRVLCNSVWCEGPAASHCRFSGPLQPRPMGLVGVGFVLAKAP